MPDTRDIVVMRAQPSGGFGRARRRAWLAGVVWVLFVASVGAAPVRVATFNVLNYLAMDRRADGKFRPGHPKPEREKNAIRAVIREVQPDVLALQEMGPAPYLEELRRDLAREGFDYPFSHLLEAADPERHVAVLSRLPFARVTPHPEVAFTYFGERELVKRGLLEVTFAAPAGEWTLFVAHLKSRLTDRPDDVMSDIRRHSEAEALRNLILQRFPDPTTARFAFAGDFNDTKDSRPLARILRRGRTTIFYLVPSADSRGEAWTHRYQRADDYSRVDFVLVSPGLWPHVAGQKGRVHDGAGALVGSDHRLVHLDLDLESAPSTAEPPEEANETTPADEASDRL